MKAALHSLATYAFLALGVAAIVLMIAVWHFPG